MCSAGDVRAGAPALVEASITLRTRLGREAKPAIATLIRAQYIQAIAFGEEHRRSAVRAFQKEGMGRHLAALNFGDRLFRACAELARQTLLFTGDDFARTGIRAA